MRRLQRGYLLVVMLIPLGAMAALTLLGSAAQSEPADRARQARDRLLAARQALIAYATGYVDLYGPGGAGPGHLPCPDTDPLPTTNAPATASGPNPPCGRGAMATGRLPTGVLTERQRYRFARHEQYRPRYTVSTAFINNPLDRAVNPGVMGSKPDEASSDTIAMIYSAPAASDTTAGSANRRLADWSTRQRVLIRRADILPPATRRVTAWLLERIQTTLKAHCDVQGPPCLVPLPACTTDSADDTENADGTAMLAEPEGRDLLISGVRIAAWLTDVPVVNGAPGRCEKIAIEATPMARHWFIRNRWHRFTQLQIDRSCVEALSACSVVLESQHSIAALIRLRLIASNAGSGRSPSVDR